MSDILPPSGIIRLTDLATWFEVSPASLATNLTKAGVPILRMGNTRRSWSIRLEDLKRCD